MGPADGQGPSRSDETRALGSLGHAAFFVDRLTAGDDTRSEGSGPGAGTGDDSAGTTGEQSLCTGMDSANLQGSRCPSQVGHAHDTRCGGDTSL